MPYNARDVMLRLGVTTPPGMFPILDPPKPYAPYTWSPVRYMLGDPEYRDVRWYVEALLAYSAYANDASQLEEYRSVLGADACGLYKYFSPLTPNWCWFKWPQVTYIAFSGTSNWAQFMFQVIGMIQGPPRSPIQGNIGSFWAACANAVDADVEAELHKTAPNSGFVMAGHSMGGVVAEIMARYRFQFQNWAARRVVSFGSPRVGDLGWSRNDFPPLYRCITQGDPVTLVPVAGGLVLRSLAPAPANLLGLCDFYHSKGRRFEVYTKGGGYSTGTDRSGADGVADVFWSQLIGDFAPQPHRMKYYVDQLGNNLFSERRPQGTFINNLWLAYVHLRQAINDYP